ncbi:hypothetical protein ERN12_10785 [Rhodobacteraceae bacterium]|nr:hypothetical protein ERN12_10785 [Paracoccaceae bacterium]
MPPRADVVNWTPAGIGRAVAMIGSRDLRVMGEDLSELLDKIAAQMTLIQIARIERTCCR